jgi:hypothetical protein
MTYNDVLSDLFEVPDNIQKIINSYDFENIKKEEFKNQYYNNSILIDNNNRKIKLGKLFEYLQKLFQLLIDNKIYMHTLKNNTKIYENLKNDLTKLQKEFINDKSRAKIEQSNEYAVIISRAPYDNLGMSTGRKWDSCVSLIDGNRKQYVPVHIKNGGLVAYLVHKNDKNIDNPVSRARITRFERWDNENKISIKDNYLLYSGFEVYGFSSEKFHNFIRNWCQENSKHDIDGLYCVAPDEQYAHQAKNIKDKKFDDFENARNERRYNQ